MTADARLTHDVVIAGGSFVGLALALALDRCAPPDFRIAVLDARPADAPPAVDGRATAISAASRRLFEAIGVWSALAADAQPVTGIEITDSDANATARPALLTFDTALEAAEPAAHIVENVILRAALADAVTRSSRIRLRLAGRVTGYTADPHAAVVELADGTGLACRLLVAADGRRSALRQAAGIRTIGWSYPQLGIVATVAHERPHEGRAVQHFLPAGPFAILPLVGRRASLVWTEQRDRATAIMALDDDAFLGELTQRFGARLGTLALAGPRVAYPLEMHIARRWIARRFALVGDAAHGVHPLAGQGLNIGLRDVAALAEVVVDAVRLGLDIGAESVLERYQRWRRFDAVFSAAAMDGLNRLFSNDNAVLRAARDLGLGLVERLPGAKRLFVAEAAGVMGELPRLLRGEPL